jgi:DEAD/DEAH box helicase domain-containing protein
MILESHLHCAAFEMSLSIEEDREYFGDEMVALVSSSSDDVSSEKEGVRARHCFVLDPISGRYLCNEHYRPQPSKLVSIRSIDSDEKYVVVDATNGKNEVLEEMEHSRVIFTIYEGEFSHFPSRPPV